MKYIQWKGTEKKACYTNTGKSPLAGEKNALASFNPRYFKFEI